MEKVVNAISGGEEISESAQSSGAALSTDVVRTGLGSIVAPN